MKYLLEGFDEGELKSRGESPGFIVALLGAMMEVEVVYFFIEISIISK